MLTPQKIQFLYNLLDQINVSGEDNKAMVVDIMRDLREMAQPPPVVPPEPPKPKKKKAKKK